MSEAPYCGNPDALMSYLYEEGDDAGRRAFEAHLRECEACATEARGLKAVRAGLAHWVPPDTLLDFRIVRDEPARRSWRSWLTLPVMPVWAQLGAAALLVGVAVGISGFELRYDDQGVTVRTGWQRPAAVPASAPATAAASEARAGDAPWRADLAALEQQIRSELRQPSGGQTVAASAPAGRAMSDDEFLSRVRQLIDASETRQQRELALRLTQVVRDMDTQRRSDMVRVADGLGVIEGRTGAVVARQRDMLDYLMRVSSQREPR